MDASILEAPANEVCYLSHKSSSYLDAEFSLFARCRADESAGNLKLLTLIAEIRNGRWRKETEEIRMTRGINKEQANELKVKKMPVVKFSGSFISSNANGLIKHSGFLCLDFDDVKDHLDNMRYNLSQDSHVLSYFISVGGHGLKVIVRINASNADEHKRCFQAAYMHFGQYVPIGGRLDTAPSNVSSNCFVSYDPDVWVSDRPCSVFEPLPAKGPFILNVPKQSAKDAADLVEEEEKEEEVISVESKESKDSRASTDLQSNKHIRKKAEARLKAMEQGDLLHIKKLYDKYLAHRRAIRGQRYKFLQKAIPAIYPLLSTDVIVQFLLLHYDLNTGSWNTSRNEHEKEIVQMLKDWSANDYPAQLSANELMHYNMLDDEFQKAAFRICRGLNKAKYADGTFFMGFGMMGLRIGGSRKTGEAVLQELCANQIIQQTERGIARSKGQHGKATKWKWLLNK